MMHITSTTRRHIGRAAVIGTALLLVAALAGCYWTPPQDEGAITISVSGETLAGSEITASAEDDPDTFFFAQIASESLLKGDPETAESAITEANRELQEAFQDATTTESGDFESFDITASVPDVQLQAAFVNLGEATGSSSNFSGLRAGESYLVTVYAGRFDTATESSPDFNIGFTTATVTGGETQTVNLTLDATPEEYAQFMDDEYGVQAFDDEPTEDEPTLEEPLTAELYLFASDQASDVYWQSPPEQPDVHFDIIDASNDSITFDAHKVEVTFEPGQFYASDTAGQAVTLAERLTQMSYLSVDDATIDPSSGTRPILPSDGSSVGTLTVGQEIQIVVTDASTRGVADTKEDVAQFIGVTPVFTFGEDPTPIAYYYPYVSGY
ncbi:MAG: hypothetical protein ACOCU4_01565 [Alkalispirochaeta sp.]